MFLQNLRAKVGARLNGDSEAGFTLIELLVVMLILGILAAIALPAFFNQKDKAQDAKAKEYAHTAQVAAETYATDHGGLYTGMDAADLKSIEPSLNSANFTATPNATNDGYTIEVISTPGTQKFRIVRADTGALTFPCDVAGEGGCPSGGGGWGG